MAIAASVLVSVLYTILYYALTGFDGEIMIGGTTVAISRHTHNDEELLASIKDAPRASETLVLACNAPPAVCCL